MVVNKTFKRAILGDLNTKCLELAIYKLYELDFTCCYLKIFVNVNLNMPSLLIAEKSLSKRIIKNLLKEHRKIFYFGFIKRTEKRLSYKAIQNGRVKSPLKI
jgi:hypothetical protein